jgi:LIVCS family branched-chain amino acid:cation transporter
MNKPQAISFYVVGLALFAMFFGSGNLIFPLFVGQLSQDQWIPATLGFLITAVFLPFLGVVAMVTYNGSYSNFFSLFGKKGAFLFSLILLTTWIPLGSSPRCITLAHAAITSNIENFTPLWLFSLFYCVIVWFIVIKKTRMIEILGKFLTPLLLLCIALIVTLGFYIAPQIEASSFTGVDMFKRGLMEGYNTMDMIASIFFSVSIIHILRRSFSTQSETLTHTFKACIVGIILLAIVYVGLISLAATHSVTLETVSKDQLFVHIAKSVLGPELGFLAAIAVVLACLTTSVALVIVFADFLTEQLFQDAKYQRISLIITLVTSYIMSIFGLAGITSVTEPLLQIFYPTLLILILINVPRKLLCKSSTPVAS